RHPVLDGQDLAVRVRRKRARGAIPDAPRRHPRLPGGLHGRTPRLQRGRLEAETGPGPLAERRTPGSRRPPGLEAVRRGPEADAPPRVRSRSSFPYVHNDYRTTVAALDRDRRPGSTRGHLDLRGRDHRADRIGRVAVIAARRPFVRLGVVARHLFIQETEGGAPPRRGGALVRDLGHPRGLPFWICPFRLRLPPRQLLFCGRNPRPWNGARVGGRGHQATALARLNPSPSPRVP